MIRKILLIIFILIISTINVSAHPGNTDSSGGHSCFSNCTKWGYSFGEYHNHSSSSNSNNSFSFSQSNIEEDYTFYYVLLLGGFVILGIYSILKEPKKSDSFLTHPNTKIEKVELSSNENICVSDYILLTDEDISDTYENYDDLNNLRNYCKDLDKSYSDSSWFLTKFGYLSFIRLSGTTFENRQENLSNIRVGQSVILHLKNVNGPVECYVNSKSIGVIPSNKSDEVREIISSELLNGCYVESIRGGNDNKYYGVIIVIVLDKNVDVQNF